MTHQIENPVHNLVSDVIAGSLITQRANRLGVDTEQLLNSSIPDTTEIYSAITEFGFNPDITATHTLLSLTVYLKNPQIVDMQIERISKLLWNSLGDPERNGATPPAQYKEAADCVYTWFILSLLPSRFSSKTDK